MSYFQLAIGALYIDLNGCSVALSNLDGDVSTCGTWFTPTGSNNRYLICTRRETQREKADSLRAHRATLQVSAPEQIDGSDWK